MKITEKLTRLSDGKNKAELARSVGLKATMISDYIAKGYAPRSDIALKMARAFSVSVDWLIDDAQDWPPPKEPVVELPPASTLSDAELLRELAIRYRRDVLDFLNTLEAGAKFDWTRSAEELEQLQPGQTMPELPRRGLALLVSLESKLGHVRQDFNVEFYAVVNHDTLPGSDRTLEELESASGGWAYFACVERPDLTRFLQVVRSRSELTEAKAIGRLDYYTEAGRKYREALSEVDQLHLMQKARERFGVPQTPGHPPSPATPT